MCAWCENKKLSEDGCGSCAYSSGPCTEKDLNERRAKCLKGYKPRNQTKKFLHELVNPKGIDPDYTKMVDEKFWDLI